MGTQLIDPSTGKVVTVAEHLYAFRGDTPAVTASASLATALGYALEENVGAVVIINVGALVLRVQHNGTDASLTSGGTLQAGASQTYYGGKEHLDKMRLFSDGAGTTVSIDQLASIRGR